MFSRHCDFSCDSDSCCVSVSFPSILSAREIGWLVSRSGRCYCPSCALFYRNVGRSGKPRKHIQLKITPHH